MRWRILWLWLDQMIFVSWLSRNLVLIWLSTTLLAKQSSWYCQEDLDLGNCIWRSCIVQLWGVTWVFISCSMLWSSWCGNLLCVRLLVLLLLVVPPINVSRIPLNIHLDFFCFFLFLLIVLRAGPWTLLPACLWLTDVMLSFLSRSPSQAVLGSPLVFWVAVSLVQGRWPAIFLIWSSDTMVCLHW